MLAYRSWELRTNRVENNVGGGVIPPVSEISFRYVEKNAMHIAKHLIQALVLIVVKYWLIMATKTKKWISENWPKVNNFFQKKPQSTSATGVSFVQRAVLESKSKIRKIKEQVALEHGKEEGL